MTEQELKIFTETYCRQLQERIQNEYKDYYKNESFADSSKNPKGRTGIYLPPGLNLRVPDSTNGNYDAENAITLHGALKNITPIQASDPRLWTYLTHITFWSYMRARWPIEKFGEEVDADYSSEDDTDAKRIIKFIEWRYFLQNSNSRRLIRNGISRLWWVGYMTVLPGNEDPYRLTKVLIEYQDISQNLLERSFGRNRGLLHSILEFIDINKSNLNREKIRLLIKEINLTGGVKNILMLERSEKENLIKEIASEIL